MLLSFADVGLLVGAADADERKGDARVANFRHNLKTPLGRLPLEMVGMILEFSSALAASTAVDGIGEANWLLHSLLSSCSILRWTAFRTPILWSFIQFPYPYSPNDEDSARKHLSRHLELSRCLTFVLRLDLSRRQYADVQLLKYLLQPHMNRCSFLEVIESQISTYRPSFFPLTGEMPNIQQIVSCCPYSQPPELLGRSFHGPNLSSLTCTFPSGELRIPICPSFPYGPISFRSSAIPIHLARLDLRLTNSHLTDVLRYAASLPLLERLRVICFNIIAHDLEANTALVFPNLQILAMDVGWADMSSLTEIIAPKLTSLEMTFSKPDGILDSFWKCSHFPNLSVLGIVSGPVLHYDMVHFICLHTSLNTLAFQVEEQDLHSESLTIWRHLMSRIAADFPKLQILQFQSFLEPNHALWLFCLISLTMQQRRSIRCRWIQTPDNVGDFPQALLEHLQEQEPQWEWGAAESSIFDKFFPTKVIQ